MARHSPFTYSTRENGQISNEERLRAYDAAQNQDFRQQLAGEKFDFQQQKAGFDQAQKESELNQRIKQTEAINTIREERYQSLEAKRAADEAVKRAEEAALTAKAKHTEEVANSAVNVFSAIAQLDRSDPQFIQKLNQLRADNPAAMDHPKVVAALDYERNLYDKTHAAKAAGKIDPTQALQDAFASSHPTYGDADSGGNFTATASGTSPQTHVKVDYIDPHTGKPVIGAVLPRPFFDNAVAASQARQTTQANQAASGNMGAPAPTALPNGLTPVPDESQVPPTTTGKPAPAPVTPVAPQVSPEDQAAISWATANPNDPRAAKIKALHGVQ